MLCSVHSLAQMRIVCIGNSITQGSGTKKFDGSWEYSYRPWLWDKLKTDGFNVDMVGFHANYFGEDSQNPAIFPSNNGVFDRDNEGYYGINSTSFLNGENSSIWTGSSLPKFSDRINDPIKGYTPDFALVHLGTNDADSTAALLNLTKNNIREVIKVLRAKNPNVVILLAKLITVWKKINPEVDGMCAELTTLASPVIAVDLATGFINDPGLSGTMTYDWVHPNKLGQIAMMRGWYKALIANLNDKTKPTIIEKLAISDVKQNSANLTWDLATDNYGVKSYEVYANKQLVATLTNKPKFPLILNSLSAGTKYEFTVVVKDLAGNYSDGVSALATTSGINSTEASAKLESIQIYPTITSGKITINGAKGCTVQLVNSLGNNILNQMVVDNDTAEIELKNYISGFYYLQIRDNDIVKIVKVVLQK